MPPLHYQLQTSGARHRIPAHRFIPTCKCQAAAHRPSAALTCRHSQAECAALTSSLSIRSAGGSPLRSPGFFISVFQRFQRRLFSHSFFPLVMAFL
jgi:hypothetical protein